MGLKNTTVEGIGAVADYGSAGLLFTISESAQPSGQATFKHLGTAGFWYVQFQRDVIGSGPTTTVYSLKLAPGEEYTEDNPPKGTVYALAGSGGDAPDSGISWYAGWFQ